MEKKKVTFSRIFIRRHFNNIHYSKICRTQSINKLLRWLNSISHQNIKKKKGPKVLFVVYALDILRILLIIISFFNEINF